MKIKNFQSNSKNLIRESSFSAHDRRIGVRIPDLNDEMLAYETGVHIGDGSLHITKSGTHSVRYYGHGEDDWIFISIVLPKIIKNLYNKNVKARKCSDSNKCVLNVCSKAISTFKEDSIGLSVGEKIISDLPNFVKSDKNLLAKCIRGIADTDFCLFFHKTSKTKYGSPQISCVMNNEKLLRNIAKYISMFGIEVKTKFNVRRKRNDKELIEHQLVIYGKHNLEKWMNYIGFSNPKHLSKYKLWKLSGNCPPGTTTTKRLEMYQLLQPKE